MIRVRVESSSCDQGHLRHHHKNDTFAVSATLPKIVYLNDITGGLSAIIGTSFWLGRRDPSLQLRRFDKLILQMVVVKQVA